MMIRRKRNRIDRIKSIDGALVEDQQKLKDMIVQHLQSLFFVEANSDSCITLPG